MAQAHGAYRCCGYVSIAADAAVVVVSRATAARLLEDYDLQCCGSQRAIWLPRCSLSRAVHCANQLDLLCGEHELLQRCLGHINESQVLEARCLHGGVQLLRQAIGGIGRAEHFANSYPLVLY